MPGKAGDEVRKGRAGKATDREARLEQELRANLIKRKQRNRLEKARQDSSLSSGAANETKRDPPTDGAA